MKAIIVAPKGVDYVETLDGFYIECFTRSPEAFFLVPFALGWSGFALNGIYGSQIAQGEFNPGLSLFGLPFVFGSIVLIAKAVMSVCGEVTFELKRDMLHCFVGIHPIGRRKAFVWREIASAREEVVSTGRRGNANHAIFVEGSERHVVGESLSAPQRYFVVRLLNQHRKPAKPDRVQPMLPPA